MPVSAASAKLLEGKVLAAEIQCEIKEALEGFAERGLGTPHLIALEATDHPSAQWYVGQQEKLASKLGIVFEKIASSHLPDQKTLMARIHELNLLKVHGIFIAMPLPEGFDPDEVLLAMDPKKDVEGIHPASLGLLVLRRAKLIPPTAYAVIQLIEWAVKQSVRNLRSMKAVIVGQSAIVGRPVQMLLGERRVTTTVCNTGTPEHEIQKAVSESEIVVACAGKPGLVKGSWIKPGAIVVDVGTTPVVRANGRSPLLVGDVEFEEAKKRAGWITPVPGGVGPLTVTMLMQNLITACEWQKGM